MTKKQKKILYRILAASALMIGIKILEQFTELPVLVWFVLYLIPYLTVGFDILKKAGKGILNRQVFDENFLMAVATLGAIALALTGKGEFTEAVAVMLFYQIGELFQSVAVGKSRRNISDLMDIRPDYANIEGEEGLVQVDPDEVEIGTVITVLPGEKIPIDGVVLSGTSFLNTSALTGESLPLRVGEGDPVASGCINENGLLKIETTKEFGESTASKILDLVENAGSRKSRSENFISRFARIYTPAVCCSALALALLPPLVGMAMGKGLHFSTWIYRALTFLVISCPCAVVISIPLGFFAAIGGAGSAGILVKGSNYLEALASAKTVVFDKTGTMTEGVFRVNGIFDAAMEEKKILYYAAHAEGYSTHPISRSLQAAYGEKPDLSRVSDVEEISGHGLRAKVDGHLCLAGNAKLMQKEGVSFTENSRVGTVIYLAVDGKFAGSVLISDVVKPTAKKAIEGLHRTGVKKTVMLTGDSRKVAETVAGELGIDEFYAELLPGDKVDQVEKLLAASKGGDKLVFVGDGINDAPVLSRADIGIAMGAMGSDAAIEAADVVLMDDDPAKIAKAIRIAKRCMRIVYENIYFALGVKLICLILGALGLANMWAAIFADVGVMVIAVLNAIRTLFVNGSGDGV